MAPQPSVLAPPPPSARYLTFSAVASRDARAALARLRDAAVEGCVVALGEPLTLALGKPVAGLRAFPALCGPSLAFPSTQGALWCFAGGRDASEVHDRSRALCAAVGDAFHLDEETACFLYKGGRDLSGFVDGTENPVDEAAVEAAIVRGKGEGLDGSSFVAVQRYVHDLAGLEGLPKPARDHVIGRDRETNEELEDAPDTAHVKRTAQEDFDPPVFMVRRSMPWGGAKEQGLYFVAYGESLDRFERALRRMAGLDDGVVDRLLSFTRATTGGYYWCPPLRGGKLDLRAVGV
jgi:putative iron-dependent peroxidase